MGWFQKKKNNKVEDNLTSSDIGTVVKPTSSDSVAKPAAPTASGSPFGAPMPPKPPMGPAPMGPSPMGPTPASPNSAMPKPASPATGPAFGPSPMGPTPTPTPAPAAASSASTTTTAPSFGPSASSATPVGPSFGPTASASPIGTAPRPASFGGAPINPSPISTPASGLNSNISLAAPSISDENEYLNNSPVADILKLDLSTGRIPKMDINNTTNADAVREYVGKLNTRKDELSKYETRLKARKAEIEKLLGLGSESKKEEKTDDKDSKKETKSKVKTTKEDSKEKEEAKKEKKAKENEIPKDKKHEVVTVKEFSDYDYDKRREQWHDKAGYNQEQVVCSFCKDDDNWATIKLDDGRDVCYYCWIKRPENLKEDISNIEIVDAKESKKTAKSSKVGAKKENKASTKSSAKSTSKLVSTKKASAKKAKK